MITSCAALIAALQIASAGDVLTLVPAVYPTCNLDSLMLPDGVVVDATGSSFPEVGINHVTNLTWKGGTTTGGPYGNWILANDVHVSLVGITFANSGSAGIYLNNSRSISINGWTALNRANDDIDIAGGSYIAITGGYDNGAYNPQGNMAHPDFIQGWALPGIPLAHVRITGNTLISSNAPIPSLAPGLGSQGIDFWNNNGPGSGPLDVSAIVVTGNTVETYGGSCVAINYVIDPNSKVYGNTCITLPGAPWVTAIYTTGSTLGAIGPNRIDGVIK